MLKLGSTNLAAGQARFELMFVSLNLAQNGKIKLELSSSLAQKKLIYNKRPISSSLRARLERSSFMTKASRSRARFKFGLKEAHL